MLHVENYKQSQKSEKQMTTMKTPVYWKTMYKKTTPLLEVTEQEVEQSPIKSKSNNMKFTMFRRFV